MTKRARRTLIAALCLGVGASCATTSVDEKSEGNTNWLEKCDSDAVCGRGLTCVCGRCSQPCARNGDCAGLGQTAVCLQSGGDGSSACALCVPNRVENDAGTSGAASGGGGSGGGGGGGTAGASIAGTGGNDACEPAPNPVPSPPSPSDVTTPGGDIDFFAVMYSADLGDRAQRTTTEPTAYRDIGLNVDERCGYADPARTDCTLPTWAAGELDDRYGIDNAAGAIFQMIRSLISNFTSPGYTTRLQGGGTSLLFHVSGYNGEANDDQVAVATYITGPYGAFDAADASPSVPSWDGSDHCWPIASDSVLDPAQPLDLPKSLDTTAYVRDGRIAIRHNRLTLRLDVDLGTLGILDLEVGVNNARTTCDVVRSGAGQWYLDSCVLAGRWVTDELIHQLSRFPDPATLDPSLPDKPPDPLCTNSSLYCSFRGNICRTTDISSVPPADPFQPESDCDALSFGMTLSTRPACAGGVWMVDSQVDRCPTGMRPSDDSCRLPAPPGNPACVR